MLMTITAKMSNAADFGYLVHKNPFAEKPFEKDLGFGLVTVFFPVIEQETITCCLHVSIDPIEYNTKLKDRGADAPYLSDRPFCAGSFLSSAIGKTFAQTIAGKCPKEELLIPLDLTAIIVPAMVVGKYSATDLFEPLGYSVIEKTLSCDSPNYKKITIQGKVTLANLLKHIMLLIPALDGKIHNFLDESNAQALIARGQGWLECQEYSKWVIRRLLRHNEELVELVTSSLQEDVPEEEEKPEFVSMQKQRLTKAVDILAANGCKKVVDMGMGEGQLVKLLINDNRFEKVVGVDANLFSLKRAEHHLKLNKLADNIRNKVELLQGSATFYDARLQDFDAIVLLEVMEHLHDWKMLDFERNIFGRYNCRLVLISTPNSDRNVLFEDYTPGKMRHKDHQREMTRQEFEHWCDSMNMEYGWDYKCFSIGEDEAGLGGLSQGCLFTRSK